MGRRFLSDRSQKVSVNNSESRDRPVTSVIPQVSVLGPILFLICINDMPECVNASTYLFAGDTTIYKEISCEDDVSGLQADLDQLQKWSDTWLLKFHPNKCKVRSVSNKTKLENKSSYHLYNDEGEEVELEMSEEEKKIEELVDRNLSFSKHIIQKVNKANSIMGLIRRTYTFLEYIVSIIFQ